MAFFDDEEEDDSDLEIDAGLYPVQAAILDHPARLKLLCAGRRWGKSVIMMAYLLRTALQVPGSKASYCLRDYARCLEFQRDMLANDALRPLIARTPVQFPPRIVWRNGSVTSFRSSDRPDSLRGGGELLICLDEAGAERESLLTRVLMPKCADTGGTILAAGTYVGRNWFYRWVRKSLEAPDNYSHAWEIPTSNAPHFQTPEGRERLAQLKRATPPADWLQEYECQPVAGGDRVFRGLEAVLDGVPRERPEPGHRYLIGIDLGRVCDPTGVAVLDAETGHVVHWHQYPLGLPYATMVGDLGRLCDGWGGEVFVDITGGGMGGHRGPTAKQEPYVQQLKRRIPRARGIVWTGPQKSDMVNALALEVQERRVHVVPGSEVAAQMASYAYQVNSFGLVRFAAPPGEHDDLVSALLMPAWARCHGAGRPPAAGGAERLAAVLS